MSDRAVATKHFWSRFRRDLHVLLFFTVLTLLMTWPLITQIGSVYAGNNEDLWTFQWDNWWTRYALQHGHDILFTPMQFYPMGVSLAAHSLSFYNSLLWIPLAALFGDIAAYNITVLLTFILSGYTMFKLVEYLLGSAIRDQGSVNGGSGIPIPAPRSPTPALLAGIIFAFAPYHFSQSMGHVSLASVQWFPLLALFILKATRETKRRNILWIGLTTLLITATRLQFLVLGGMVFAIFVLVDWLVLRREWTRGAWLRLIAGAVLGLLLSLPIVLPAAQLYTQTAIPDELIADEQTWGQTDLAAYFVPMTYHPVFGSIVQPLYENFIKNRAWMPYLGFVPLLLAVWGALRAKRRALPWLVIGLFSFIMALGPFLRVNGAELTNIRLPYAWIGDIFPLNTLRSPDRYNLLLPLPLAVLAAWGVVAIRQRLHVDQEVPRRPFVTGVVSIGMAVLVGGVILFEYLGIPYQTSNPPPSSPFYAKISASPEAYAILDIPLKRTDTKYYLYYQTLHEQPIVQGRVARVPPEATALFEQVPLLTAWQESLDAPRPLDLGYQLAQLAARNVRYIVLHKNWASPQNVASLRNYFTHVPDYEDDQIAVYSTRPVSDVVTLIGENIGIVNTWANADSLKNPIRIRVRWTATGPIERNYAYRLSLIDESGSSAIDYTEPITPATSTWQKDAIVIGEYRLGPAATLPPGRYTMRLSIVDGAEVHGSVSLPHRVLNVPTIDGPRLLVFTEEPRARFDSVELRAVDASRRGNVLSLWLHWFLLAPQNRNTQYFVDLIDAKSDVVAQENVEQFIPDSSKGQAGEIISSRFELPLWNLPPGEYRISVGLTNPNTDERLPAIDAAGNALPDNRYIFAETIRID
jgi:hypothetical protein